MQEFENNKKNETNKFPKFVCPECGYEDQLDFFPIDDPKRFLIRKCVECGYQGVTNLNDHDNNPKFKEAPK